MPERIGIIIVDDSAVARQVMSRELSKLGDIEVLATAADPFSARDLILQKQPTVVTLDLEMPRMDGLTFLRRVMKYSPIPVIVCSSLTQAGGAKAIECLEAGAFDVIGKPRGAAPAADFVAELADLIRAAAKARAAHGAAARAPLPAIPTTPVAKAPARVEAPDNRRLIAIGASTGGTEAIRAVLQPLGPESPGIVIVQHMPEGFTKPFSDRLNGLCRIEVREAADGDQIRPGLALIAPGNKHLRVVRDKGSLVARVTEGPPVKRHRPSVEVLFESVAKVSGVQAVGVILTGMGDDGADGMLSLMQAGAHTIAQDEASCVVYGMPRAAVAKGGVRESLPLDRIPHRLRELAASAAIAA